LLDRYEELERSIEKVNAEISREVETCRDPFVAEAIELLDSIPGVGESVAQVIISEIGVRMGQFASDKHLASWAGMCPGNNESAGKRKSGKTTKGSQYLRTALVQAAWAASRTKETYLSAQYQRLVKRMGKNKALVAVGHSILVMIYHILSRRQNYQEIGGDYFDRRNVEAQKARLIHKLEALGLRVTVEQSGVAA
jgi:transposase